jgi:hypothetical protein
MFPLFQKELPSSGARLAAALSTSLRRTLDLPRDPVIVREKAYPDLDEIAVDLSGATMRMNAPRPSFPPGEGELAVTARRLILAAHPISVAGAAVDLELDASGVVLNHNRDSDDNIVLLLHRAETGRIVISIQAQDLETLIGEIAKGEAGRQGVVIEDILLNLTSRGPRSLGAELRIQARKLFLRATIQIAGQLEIDDRLVAHMSGLSCTGEGAIGALVCGILKPHLQRLQAREFPLLALSLGEVRLYDIKLETDDGIKVIAEFGAAAAAETT